MPIPTGVVMSILTPAYTLQDWRVSFKDPNILQLLLLLGVLLILLTGKPEVCKLLLEAGAKTYHENSVKR